MNSYMYYNLYFFDQETSDNENIIDQLKHNKLNLLI